jgi:chemotaxis regulatin CheY-phosphate phosphatase CheZ
VADNLNKMPNASEQLSKVTQANEMATVEIMDVVDGILFKLDLLEKNSKAFFDNKGTTINNSIKLLDILKRGILNGSDMKPAIHVINNTIKSLEDLNSDVTKEYLGDNKRMYNEIRNDSNSIIMALQIQDITAQQIAAVNHMLGTIQNKLITILQHFQSTNIEDLVKSDVNIDYSVNVSTLHREIAFDPNAVEALNKDTNRQQNVDDLINSHNFEFEMDKIEIKISPLTK